MRDAPPKWMKWNKKWNEVKSFANEVMPNLMLNWRKTVRNNNLTRTQTPKMWAGALWGLTQQVNGLWAGPKIELSGPSLRWGSVRATGHSVPIDDEIVLSNPSLNAQIQSLLSPWPSGPFRCFRLNANAKCGRIPMSQKEMQFSQFGLYRPLRAKMHKIKWYEAPGKKLFSLGRFKKAKALCFFDPIPFWPFHVFFLFCRISESFHKNIISGKRPKKTSKQNAMCLDEARVPLTHQREEIQDKKQKNPPLSLTRQIRSMGKVVGTGGGSVMDTLWHKHRTITRWSGPLVWGPNHHIAATRAPLEGSRFSTQCFCPKKCG